MPYVKLTTGALIGTVWREKGDVIELPARLAELHAKAGTGTPVSGPAPAHTPAPVQQATAAPHGDQAVSPRQRGGFKQ